MLNQLKSRNDDEAGVHEQAGSDQTFVVSSHRVHPRLRNVELSRPALEEFFRRVDQIDIQSLEYVSFNRFVLASVLLDVVGREFLDTLRGIVKDRESGGFTMSIRSVRDNPESYLKFGTAIGHLLGPTNRDAMSGTYYARFVVKDTDNSDSYLRQAYRLFTLHTDGTFVEEATDWLLMMKFAEEHARGGESRLLHLDDWEEYEDYANHPLSNTEFEYKAPGSKNIDGQTLRPLFFDSEFGPSVSFIDQFVQPRTMEEAVFLSEFSASMERSSGTKELPLPVGDLVVVNNYFWLHGRAAFEQNEMLHRELMRQRGRFEGRGM